MKGEDFSPPHIRQWDGACLTMIVVAVPISISIPGTVMVVIVPVLLIVPATLIFVPPTVVGFPAALAFFAELMAGVISLPALIAVVFHSFVEAMVGARNAPLTIVVCVCTRYSCYCEKAGQCQRGKAPLSKK